MRQLPVQHTLDIEKQLHDRLALQGRILSLRILWRYWSRDFVAMPFLVIMLLAVIGALLWSAIYGDTPDSFSAIETFAALIFVHRSGQISRRAMAIEAGIGSWRGKLSEVRFLNDIQVVKEVLLEYLIWNRHAVQSMIEKLNDKKTTAFLADMKELWRFLISLGVGLLISWVTVGLNVAKQADVDRFRSLIFDIVQLVIIAEALFVLIPLFFEGASEIRRKRLSHLLHHIHLSLCSDFVGNESDVSRQIVKFDNLKRSSEGEQV